MGVPREVPPAKLFMGIMHQSNFPAEECLEQLKELYGPVDAMSGSFFFDQSDYYQSEMGSSLEKFFVSFVPLVPQDRLPMIKIKTNEIEINHAGHDDRRHINIDPGILTLPNVILATTKGFAHRIYMGDGIHEEVTLIYRHGMYEPLSWTYPDYRQSECQQFMKRVRDIYQKQLKSIQTKHRSA